MKSTVACMLLFAVLGIGAFGFFGMSEHENHQMCAVSLSQGLACPTRDDQFGFTTHYFSTLRNSFTAIAQSTSVAFSGLAILFLLLAFAFSFAGKLPMLSMLRIAPVFSFISARETFLRWFTRFENSPNVF